MAVDIDLVRLLIGDTDPDSQLLTDDQITTLTATFGSSTLAAAACADALAARFSRSVSFSVEGLSISNSQKAANYRELAQRLRAQATTSEAGGLGSPMVSGVSRSEMKTVADDDDREENRFSVGMMSYPGRAVSHGDKEK